MDLKKLDVKNTEIKLGDKYQLKERLGGGSFGQIFCAINLENAARVAVKLEKRSVNATLIREAKVISDMRGHTGFPSLYDYGKEENYNYIVISLLGWNLEKLFKLCDQRFSLKTVLMIADQLISRIETLHNKNYVHRDIKPENFCIGKGSSGRNVFLIDFGLAKCYRDSDGEHISFKEGKGLVGTARYASINAHLGYELGRRDDLESIGYALIYFLAGKLPWQNLKVEEKQQKYQKIAELKIQTPTDQLCQGLPEQFLTYLNYVKNLQFNEDPDYKYLKKLFRTLFIKYGYDFDYHYDWIDALRTQYSIETTIIPPLKIKEAQNEGESKKRDAPVAIKVSHKGESVDLVNAKSQKQEEKSDTKPENNLRAHEPPNSFIIPIRKRSSSRPTVILNQDKRFKSTTEANLQQIPAFRKSLNVTTLPKITLIESETKDEDRVRKKNAVRGSFPLNISSNSVFSSKNLHYNITQPLINEDREDDIPTEAIENMLGSTVGKVKQFSIHKRDISVRASEQFSPTSPKETSIKPSGKFYVSDHIKKAPYPNNNDSRRTPLVNFSLLESKRCSPRWSEAQECDVYGDDGNLNESSICEWEETNNLEQMVNQKRFFVNNKNH